MIKFKILQQLDDAKESGISSQEIVNILNISNYTVNTLLEVALGLEIVNLTNGKYTLSKIGYFLLHDEMTKVNMNFVQDVCYQGAFFLKESFQERKPIGLKVFEENTIKKDKTIYEKLSSLPEAVQKSWFDFDHYYSNDAFADSLQIVFENSPVNIFDIGGNTGKFALKATDYNKSCQITIWDLGGQLNKAKDNIQNSSNTNRIFFEEIDVLDEAFEFTKNADVIWMSQFLDCFSPNQITSILQKVKRAINNDGFVFILEPFWDKQQFETARMSLNHVSLYFTCMANGNSKMYSFVEMKEYIEQAGLEIVEVYDGIGSNDYTLLKCSKK